VSKEMLKFSRFIAEAEIVHLNRRLGGYAAKKLAGQKARETGKHHYAIEHPDGWKVSDSHPGTRWSTNNIVRVNHKGKEEEV
jgi:hypothetical protein